MQFNQYLTNEALEAQLNEWAQQFPQLFTLQTIGASHEGRPIFQVTMTSAGDGSSESKPAVWLDANIHATEVTGTSALVYAMQKILEGYGKDEKITRLLDSTIFYIVPRINPDGAAAALAAQPRMLRSGVRAYPWEEAEEGLHIQDVDGDGRILQMRIPDRSGMWKAAESDPRLLVRREPEDAGGQYYRLLPEGMIRDYDGYQIKMARPTAGLDFNRNFPFEWRPENEQVGAGPFPASEPEISAVVRFIAAHPNISLALTFHTFSRALLRPFSTRPDDQMDRSDLQVFKMLGAMGTRLTGYRHMSTYHGFTADPKDVTTGAFDDWLYDHLGAYVFTVELWDLPTVAGIENRSLTDWWDEHPVEDDLRILRWADEHVGESGYVPWKPFDHPQLGPVEIGGWNMLSTWRNPPPDLLEEEISRHLPYILSLASLLPHLEIPVFSARRVGEQAWALYLVVENTGYLPTYISQQARKRGVARPVAACLHLPEGARFAISKEREEIGHLEGRSDPNRTAVFAGDATTHRGVAHWVIEAPAGAQIEVVVSSERAGSLSRTLKLE